MPGAARARPPRDGSPPAVEAEDDREAEEVVGEHLARLDWTRVSLRGCLVHLADVAELVLDRARVIDSTLQRAGHHAPASPRTPPGAPSRCTAAGSAPGTWRAAVLDAVTVAGAQLGYVNLRDATLTDVALQ